MGRYISAADLYNEFSKDNVRKWADKTGTKSGDIDGTITSAISEAEDRLDEGLLNGRYAVPLQFSGPVSATIKRITRGLAIEYIYSARGTEDSAEQSKFDARIKQSMELLAAVSQGSIRINAMPSNAGGAYPYQPTAPMIVERIDWPR